MTVTGAARTVCTQRRERSFDSADFFRFSKRELPERRQVRCHVACVPLVDIQIGHRRAWLQLLRLLQPESHPDLFIRKTAGDVTASAHVVERRSHQTFRSRVRQDVTAGAAVLHHELASALRVPKRMRIALALPVFPCRPCGDQNGEGEESSSDPAKGQAAEEVPLMGGERFAAHRNDSRYFNIFWSTTGSRRLGGISVPGFRPGGSTTQPARNPRRFGSEVAAIVRRAAKCVKSGAAFHGLSATPRMTWQYEQPQLVKNAAAEGSAGFASLTNHRANSAGESDTIVRRR